MNEYIIDPNEVREYQSIPIHQSGTVFRVVSTTKEPRNWLIIFFVLFGVYLFTRGFK